MVAAVVRWCASIIDSTLFWGCVRAGSAVAVVFRPSTRWHVLAGYALECMGKSTAAVISYERGIALSRDSGRVADARWMRVAQFLLERRYHALGRPRVEDPLFDASLEVAGSHTGEGRPAGMYKVELTCTGLKVTGIVFCTGDTAAGPQRRRIYVYLNDVLLRRVAVSRGRFWQRFEMVLTREAIAMLPQSGTLTLLDENRAQLATFGGGAAVQLRIPYGNDTLLKMLKAGRKLEKKGSLQPDKAELNRRHAAYLALYQEVQRFFLTEFNKPLFLMYGTLLGYYRDGDFIDGDDDFDVAYVSGATDPLHVKAEALEMVQRLVCAGFTITVNSSGRLFRVSREDFGGTEIHLDTRPLWFQDGNLWVHLNFTMPAAHDDILPVSTGALRGITVYAPRNSEKILAGYYGPGWSVPDPGYTNYHTNASRSVRKNFSRAHMTPVEYSRVQHELCAGQSSSVGSGTFRVESWEDLYPLKQESWNE